MNLINRVLHDLEQRGSALPDPTGSIRAVPGGWRLRRIMLMAGGTVLTAAAGGAWFALWIGSSAAPPSSVAHRQAPRAIALRSPMSQPPMAVVVDRTSAAASVASGPAEAAAAPLTRSPEKASMPAPAKVRGLNADHQEGKSGPEPAVPPEAKQDLSTRPAAPEEAGGKKPPIKQVSRQQQADGEFNQALLLTQQGRKSEAQQHLEAALRLNPQHAQARQALVGLLLEEKRTDEAERLLRDWLHDEPEQVGVAMLLARVQVEEGRLAAAQETLQKVATYAADRADFHAFLAAVSQRQGQHDEAVKHYQIALRQSPDTAVWLMGLGISLQALKRKDEARNAYKRALDTHSLSKELQDYVERRMKDL